MRYDFTLGIFGNIERLFKERNATNATIANNKASYDADKITMEQSLTDLDISNLETAEMLTDLDIRLMMLEG